MALKRNGKNVGKEASQERSVRHASITRCRPAINMPSRPATKEGTQLRVKIWKGCQIDIALC